MGWSGDTGILFDTPSSNATQNITLREGYRALQISNTASGTSFNSLHKFFMGLERLDCICGLPYGGAAISKASSKPLKKPSSHMGMVASVQEGTELPQQKMEFAESWIGAINLDEDHVKILRSLFKCPQCHTNTHTFPSCPLLKHWHIKKKTRTDISPDISIPLGQFAWHMLYQILIVVLHLILWLMF